MSHINVKEKLESLKKGDYIAFGYNYNGGEPNEIIVDNISFAHDDDVIVHFLYGYRGLSERVNKADIIAIGNHEGEGKIPGWRGSYDILKPNHPLLQESE